MTACPTAFVLPPLRSGGIWERRLQEIGKKWFGCVSNLGAAKRLRVKDQNKNIKEKTYAIHDADDPECLQRQQESDAGFVPDPKKIEAMGRFNEELGKAVKILSLNGLHPLSTGARVSFGKGKPTVTDGPFIETKEVLGGYWMVEANSKEELVKWAQRCPADEGDVIEIRQIFDMADFAIKK